MSDFIVLTQFIDLWDEEAVTIFKKNLASHENKCFSMAISHWHFLFNFVAKAALYQYRLIVQMNWISIDFFFVSFRKHPSVRCFYRRWYFLSFLFFFIITVVVVFFLLMIFIRIGSAYEWVWLQTIERRE